MGKVFWENKVIGAIEGRVFRKTVKGSRHKLQKPPAWAIDANAYLSLVLPFADWIEILDKETGDEYRVSVADFDKFKVALDRGYDKQFYLTMGYWSINGHEPLAKKMIEKTNQMKLEMIKSSVFPEGGERHV